MRSCFTWVGVMALFIMMHWIYIGYSEIVSGSCLNKIYYVSNGNTKCIAKETISTHSHPPLPFIVILSQYPDRNIATLRWHRYGIIITSVVSK